ncbi:MAG: hypothetical protein NTW79_01330, partial [Candidatus Berkelbacteria bacterium]|nr:hypothetical protein [Candidatus Berkelbacteria bacterium]
WIIAFVGMITVAATAGFGIGRDYMIRKNLLSMITMTGLLIGALEFFDSRFRMLGFDFFQSSFPFLMAINVLLVSFTAGSIIAKCSGRVLAKKMPEQNPET